MKSYQTSIILFLLINFALSGLPTTPKASGLENHFGTETTLGIYGPKANVGAHLMRRGAAGGAPITEIKNFNQQINSSQVKSGDLTNTSYDAGKIITPHIASKLFVNNIGPKAEIKAEFVHDAIIKTPVQLGTVLETNTITTMSRVDGKISVQKVVTEKPVIGILNTVIYYV